MDMNTVISWGLSIMGGLAVIGWIIISIHTGTSSGTEVPISIISGLSGVLTGKNIAENRMRKKMMEETKEDNTEGKAAEAAGQENDIAEK